MQAAGAGIRHSKRERSPQLFTEAYQSLAKSPIHIQESATCSEGKHVGRRVS